MKILIVSESDINGGAARAAYRLHESLNLFENIESIMLVQNKESDDFKVVGPSNKLEKGINKIRPTIDMLPTKFYKNKSNTYFSPSMLGFSNIIDSINKLNPDIVHLHWICGGMLRIEELKKINVPIVWSLHDMWAFTGGCHYNDFCENYMSTCGNCKVLNSEKVNDLSKKIYNRKKDTYSSLSNMTIVGLSQWLTTCAQKSTLLYDKEIINLPNPINIQTFKPVDKKIAREIWGLPLDKKLILFGAMGATSDPRKGFNELKNALLSIPTNENIELIVFGSSSPKEVLDLGFKINYVGRLRDDISMQLLLNVADVMVVPSIQENLSNSIMESLSCGTPVVAFHIGGNSDMINHMKNGFLAKPYDSTDLAKGINWVLNNYETTFIAQAARDSILNKFTYDIVGNKYIELYKRILIDEK